MGTSVTPSIFVLPSKVVARMQINSELEGVTGAILSALVGAQLQVETVLGSQMAMKAWTAKYHLDEDAFSGIQPGGTYQLETPSGFLRSDVPLLFSVGSTWQMLEATTIPSADYEVDLVRGLVTLHAENYHGKFVRIAATTGFTSGNALDLVTTPPEAIPDWLEEAIISFTGVIFDTTQTTNRNAEAADIYKRASDHALSILSPYLRVRGFVFRPISTS